MAVQASVANAQGLVWFFLIALSRGGFQPCATTPICCFSSLARCLTNSIKISKYRLLVRRRSHPTAGSTFPLKRKSVVAVCILPWPPPVLAVTQAKAIGMRHLYRCRPQDPSRSLACAASIGAALKTLQGLCIALLQGQLWALRFVVVLARQTRSVRGKPTPQTTACLAFRECPASQGYTLAGADHQISPYYYRLQHNCFKMGVVISLRPPKLRNGYGYMCCS